MYPLVQQIKNSLRNKRFVIFTLVFPSVWYIFLVTQFKGKIALDPAMLASFSALFGIAGSGINTFSTKISKEKYYFRVLDKISPYSYVRYMVDSVSAQTILNVLILLVVTIIGLLLGHLQLTGVYLVTSLLLLYFGLYYIVIGFFLGTLLNDETLISVSMPIFFVFMALDITPNLSKFIHIPLIVNFQKLFPGYYFNAVLVNYSIKALLTAFLIITLHLLMMTLAVIILNKLVQTKGK